jgi:hypothetical protein
MHTAYEPAINEVVVPVLNRDLCNEWLDTLNVTEGMICAGYEVVHSFFLPFHCYFLSTEKIKFFPFSTCIRFDDKVSFHDLHMENEIPNENS